MSWPQGEPEGDGFPASLSFPFLPKLVLQLNLFLGGRGRLGVGEAPDPSRVGSVGMKMKLICSSLLGAVGKGIL